MTHKIVMNSEQLQTTYYFMGLFSAFCRIYIPLRLMFVYFQYFVIITRNHAFSLTVARNYVAQLLLILVTKTISLI